MNKSKNKGAVYLGRLSAEKRKKKLGVKAFREKMKHIRSFGKQKKLSTEGLTNA